MRHIVAILFFSFLYLNIHAQALIDHPNNIYQTKSGKELSLAEARGMLNSSQRYQLDKKKLKDGSTLVTLLPISEKDFQKSIQNNQKKVKKLKGQEMIAFELSDKTGETISNESLKGKLTVYNFWFTGCRPCLVEMPQLNKLVDKYKDQVNFIAPTFQDEKLVSRFLERRTFKYNTLASGTEMIKKMFITSFPTHLIVDKNGVIRNVLVGGSEDIGKTLEKLINKNL